MSATVEKKGIGALEWNSPVGRELDAFVAEHVMGWTPHVRNTAHWTDAAHNTCYSYDVRGIVGAWTPSRNLYHAWQVVERLRELGCADVLVSFHEQGGYEVEVNVTEEMHKQGYRTSGASGTAPECICRAALICVAGVKK